MTGYTGAEPGTVALYHLNQTAADIPTIGDSIGADSGPYGVAGKRGLYAPWNSSPGYYTGDWGPSWGTGNFGGGLDFHGKTYTWPAYDRGVSIRPDVSQETRSMTVEAWIKPDDGSFDRGYERLIEKWWQYAPGTQRYRIGYDDRPDIGRVDQLQAQIEVVDETTGALSSLSFNTSNNAITKGVWQHIALTVDDSTKIMKLWVNGVGVGSMDITGYKLNLAMLPGSQGGPDTFVGGSPWDGSAYWYQGSIDEIRFSNVAREFLPEPATMTLLGIGGLLLLRKRRNA